VTLALGFGGGAYAGYRWEHGALSDLKLADANAQVVALDLQHASDMRQAKVNQDAAVKEASAQNNLKLIALTIHERIPVFVTPAQDARVCVTVGLVRVLRAAEDGVTPDTLTLALGQSDDDCADFAASALADNLTARLSVGNQNAEQLNALEAWLADNHVAQQR
jgi:hypothetical protein